MKTVTLYTSGHYETLRGMVIGDDLHYEEDKWIRGRLECFDLARLAALLEDLVLDENPVVKNSPRLFQYVKELVFRKQREKILRDFVSFAETGGRVHLEGYARFRMKEYQHAVNRLLYSIIKKIDFLPEE